MSALAMTRALASIFVPIGITGAVIALACALLATFALARGSAGLAGGAIGVWIVGAMLSMAASFASLWTPFLVAAVGLAVALVVGPSVRAASAPLRTRAERRHQAEQDELAGVKPPASAPRPLSHSTDVVAVV